MRNTRFWILSLAAALAAQLACPSSVSRREYAGVFQANDSGQSGGGFEWAGLYTARLTAAGDRASLEITFSQGLGDPLTRHQFAVTEFAEAAGMISFKIVGRRAVLVLADSGETWDGKYKNSYSANRSDLASEQIGTLPIDAFSGFKSHYYIEIRLKAVRKEADLFLGSDRAFF